MQSIPQIVRDRLKAAPVSVNHPEADVLTAFSEHLLSETERTAVLEHLSSCRECREIASLALPETDTTIKVKVPARSRWLIWPGFRWGFAATGVVAIALFGFVEHQRSMRPLRPESLVAKESQNQALATYDQGGPPAAATTNNIPNRTVPAAAAASGEKARHAEPLLTAQGRPPTQSSPTAVATGQRNGFGPKMPMQWQQQQTTEQQARAFALQVPPTAAKQRSADTSANVNGLATEGMQAQVSQDALTTGQSQTPAAPLPSQPSEQFFDYDSGVGKAKPASNTHAAAAAFSGPMARWNISSTGALQRSFDQGATWQDVDVSASAAGAPTFALMAHASRAKEAKDADKADKKVPAAPIPPPVFRVVAVNGADIWAGGSSGVLYHSLDFGNHWTRVLLSSAGRVLTGDIVGLEFSDSQHGKITTAAGELWTTSDGGFTWVKL